jgi:hypothetical protein
MKISMQNRFTRLVPIMVLVAIVALLVSAPVYAVDPVFVAGNPACPAGYIEFKINNTPAAGQHTDGTLVVTITRVDNATGQAFNWSSNIGVDVVIVKGGPNANVYTYIPEASGDSLLHSPLNSDNGKYFDISHVSFCYDFEVDVTKSATPYFTRTFNWTIEKSVNPDTLALFTGDSADVEWEIIIDQTDTTDSNFYVVYNVSVSNPSPFNTKVTLTDALFTSAVNNTCPEVEVDLNAGQSINCSYTVNYPNAVAGNTVHNTVNADANGGGVGDDSAGASATFTNPTTLVNDTVTLADLISLNGGATSDITASFTGNPVITGDATLPFVQNLDCDDEGTTHNVATIKGDDGLPIDSDDAEVTVTCYDLTVVKTAPATYTRAYDWYIAKTSPTTALTVPAGSSSPVINYTVTVGLDTPAYTDDNFVVDGTITVTNPAPIAAYILSVSDLISGVVDPVTVDCGVTFPHSLAAGGTLDCTYSSNLPDATARTNTATATLQNYDYDVEGVGTASGTTDFSKTVNVTFSTPALIDECIVVSDDHYGNLGTVCYNDPLPKVFNYSLTWTVPADVPCGTPYQFVNTASFETVDDENDTDQSGSDDHVINVTVPCAGCTLTQGYWKTHSAAGPAPYDDAWLLLGDVDGDGTSEGAGENFYNALKNINKTYYDVLWTAPQGNAYYNLAHQYIAAKLNILNGASSTPAVDAAINWAETFFTNNLPTTSLSKSVRNQVLANATTLDRYNNGLIGPGHCSE